MSETLSAEPRLPVARHDIGIDERRLHIERERLALRLRQLRHEIWNHHVKAGEDDVFCRDAMRFAIADIADTDRLAALTHIDHGRCETDADAAVVAIESIVVKAGEHDVVHGTANRYCRNERAHQQARQRGVAVGEMIDVRLAPFGMVVGGKAEGRRSRDNRSYAARTPAPRRSRARRSRAGGPGNNSPPPRCSRRA